MRRLLLMALLALTLSLHMTACALFDIADDPDALPIFYGSRSLFFSQSHIGFVVTWEVLQGMRELHVGSTTVLQGSTLFQFIHYHDPIDGFVIVLNTSGNCYSLQNSFLRSGDYLLCDMCGSAVPLFDMFSYVLANDPICYPVFLHQNIHWKGAPSIGTAVIPADTFDQFRHHFPKLAVGNEGF